MMRVAHLIDSFGWGGAEKWIASFSEVACLRGLSVTVISLEPFVESGPYRTQIESFGASFEAFSITRLYTRDALPVLIRTLRAGKFDIIQTHLSHANILGALAGRWVGLPVVATLHSAHLNTQGRNRSRSMVEQIVLRYGAHRIIAVGSAVADVHRQRFGGRTLDIVPNGVEPGVELSPQEREILRTQLAGDPQRTLVIAVGRLIPSKGYAELLSAFARIRIKHPKAFLVIVGDGESRPGLEELVRVLHLTDDVGLLGFRTDVPRILAAGDIFVSASYWEGLSMAMLEAMAAGLPILSTSVGEAPYLLASGRGLLVQPRNVDELVTGLDTLLESTTTRPGMGAAARRFCESNYSLDLWLDKILKVYASIQTVPSGSRVNCV